MSSLRSAHHRHPWLAKRAAHDSKCGSSPQLPIDRTSQLWMVHGKWYDLSAFVVRHPGGESWLRDTRGCDVTELVETHHFNMQRVDDILEKCYVGDAAADYKGYFESDDEVGVVFKQIQTTINQLDRFKGEEQ